MPRAATEQSEGQGMEAESSEAREEREAPRKPIMGFSSVGS